MKGSLQYLIVIGIGEEPPKRPADQQWSASGKQVVSIKRNVVEFGEGRIGIRGRTAQMPAFIE